MTTAPRRHLNERPDAGRRGGWVLRNGLRSPQSRPRVPERVAVSRTGTASSDEQLTEDEMRANITIFTLERDDTASD